MTDVLSSKIERLKEEIGYLEKNKAAFLKKIDLSVDVKKMAERSVYLCSEIALDISDMVLSLKGLPKPSTYSDSIYKLGEYGIVPASFARKFTYIAGIRNFLAHDYHIDTASELKRFLKFGINDIKKFVGFIEKQ